MANGMFTRIPAHINSRLTLTPNAPNKLLLTATGYHYFHGLLKAPLV
jgi:hypothetical protein